MGEVQEIYEMKGAGRGIREISQELDVSRNTVRRYLKSPEALRPKPRPLRGSMLDPYKEHIDRRMGEGLSNCRVLDREVRALGYEGSYSTVVQYVRPWRRSCQPDATVRFAPAPGEQAQVNWGSFAYVDEKGRTRRVWAFVMVLSWSLVICVEFVRRADTASFIQCHVNAFEHFGGVPRRCLYDNAKVVTLGRDEEGRTEWNRWTRRYTSTWYIRRTIHRLNFKPMDDGKRYGIQSPIVSCWTPADSGGNGYGVDTASPGRGASGVWATPPGLRGATAVLRRCFSAGSGGFSANAVGSGIHTENCAGQG